MSVRMKTEDGDIILSGKGKDGKDGTSGIPVPQVAEVGQILAVKAVDEEGKPIEWETVDKGGGSGDDALQPFIIDDKYSITYDSTTVNDLLISGWRIDPRYTDSSDRYNLLLLGLNSTYFGIRYKTSSSTSRFTVNKGEVPTTNNWVHMWIKKSDVEKYGIKQIKVTE